MAVLSGPVAVPDTSGDMTVNAVPLGAPAGIPRYVTLMAIGPTCFFHYQDPNELDAENNPLGIPSAQHVIDNGFPLIAEIPISLQPVYDTEQVDPSRYWLAKSGSGAGDVRVIS